MRSPLRDKIQNAINKAISQDCNNNNNKCDVINNNDVINSKYGSPCFPEGALIVGGRRRSRRKKNKKNAFKKKKSPSLDSIKNRLSPASCRKGTDSDVAPLINDEECSEDTDPKMPLFGKKKKAPEPPATEGEAIKMENGSVDTADGGLPAETENPTENPPPADTAAEKQPEADVRGVTVEKKEVDGNVAVTFTAGSTETKKEEAVAKEEEVTPESAEPSQSAPTTTKTEKSPLIDGVTPHDPEVKDSKLRDHSPGFLCCSIL